MSGRKGDFWTHVAVGAADECWPYTGCIGTTGYGKVGWSGKTYKAHRVAWEKTYGPIPAALLVLHHCDNRPCCNPAHLFLGTVRDNIHDGIAKGRYDTEAVRRGRIVAAAKARGRVGLRGEQNPRAKVTSQQVIEIRALYEAGDISQERIADRFGVSQVLVSKIVRREIWAWL